MTTSGYSPWLHRFALLTVLATLCLIGMGGLVTSHGVGMAVPDWPNTYGYNMFLFPMSQWVGGILYEHSHRLVGAVVGLLTAVLAVWLWARETSGWKRWFGVAGMCLVIFLLGVREMAVYLTLAGLAPVVICTALFLQWREAGSLRWLGVAGLAAVTLQGVLGGLRVVWIEDSLGIVHATLAQLFFVLVAGLALATSRWWKRSSKQGGEEAAPAALRWLLMGATILILAQLVIGAAMRHQHAGLAIPDFPLAYGSLWPDMSGDAVARYNQQRVETVALNPITPFQIGLHMVHRTVALAVLVAVAGCLWLARKRVRPRHPLRRLSVVWLVSILTQAGLGAWTIWSNKAADIATLHVLGGALSLVTGALCCITAFRRPATAAREEAVVSANDATRANVVGVHPEVLAGR